jgi:hypothetical protein
VRTRKYRKKKKNPIKQNRRCSHVAQILKQTFLVLMLMQMFTAATAVSGNFPTQ